MAVVVVVSIVMSKTFADVRCRVHLAILVSIHRRPPGQHRLVGLVVRRPPLEPGFFRGRVIPVT